MPNLRPHALNERKLFIAGWYADDTGVCDELIQYHQDSPHKREGLMSGGVKVDKNIKDSIDVSLERPALGNRYMEILSGAAKAYIAQYPHSGKLVPWGVKEPVAIQHYKPGGGYKAWHFERDNSNDVIAHRHLAFMTYLNDVDEGGGTEFYYQELTVKAEKGLTLLWPAEWNFTHRGQISHTQEKYIITGWFSTYTREEFLKFNEHYRKSAPR